MIREDKLIAMFKPYEGMEKEHIWNHIVKDYGMSLQTAKNYYYRWKGIYTHSKNCKPKEPMKIVDLTTNQELQKPKVSFVDAIIHTDQEIKKAIKDNAKIIINAASEMQKEDIKVDDSKVLNIKEGCGLEGFKPLLLKGKELTFRFKPEGVTIECSEDEFVTQAVIEEQQRALKIWKECYGGIVNE